MRGSTALALVSLLVSVSCSTVETTGSGATLAAQLPSEHFQLKVRTGDDRMDATLYQTAYQQFSRVMPLRQVPPFTGTLELTFASASQSNFQASTTGEAAGHAKTGAWYTGGGALGSMLGAGTFLQWQDSTMLAVLKHNDGAQLWTAAYDYKGGYELSGFVVNTPEKAARLVTKRLAVRFAADSKR
jgi:hypothetical protein